MPALVPEINMTRLTLLGLICEGQYEEMIAAGKTSAAEVTEKTLDVFFRGIRGCHGE